MSIITLLTDFGLADPYVAAMKGVILQASPRSTIIDVTHQVQPHNVLQAAFILRQVFEYFAAGTVHVAVVDPGVGTGRPIIAAKYAGQFIVAPDNGLVSLVHRDFLLEELRLVQNETLFARTVGATFHGRDIFAPTAAHVAKAGRLTEVGPPTDRLALMGLPACVVHPDGRIVGQILYIDQFGNAITNVAQQDLGQAARRRRLGHVRIGEHDLGPLRHAYGEVPAGEPLALIGSAGTLEVAVNQGSAAARLHLAVGQEVCVE